MSMTALSCSEDVFLLSVSASSVPCSVTFPAPWREGDRHPAYCWAVPLTLDTWVSYGFLHNCYLLRWWRRVVSATLTPDGSRMLGPKYRRALRRQIASPRAVVWLSFLPYKIITWFPHIFIYLIVFDALGSYILQELCQSLGTIFHKS